MTNKLEQDQAAGKVRFFTGVICGFVIAALLAALLSWYTYKGKAVAKVNGTSIRYYEFHEDLEKFYGSEVIEYLIQKTIVRQEAEKRKIVADKKEIDKRFNDIKSKYPSEEEFQSFLKQERLTAEDIREQIIVQLLAEKLVGKMDYQEKDLLEYYEQFRYSRYNDQPYEKVENQVKKDYESLLRARLVPQTIQNLLEKAKVSYYW
ncbi:MAG: SurA N-terminal domain-containing protein [Bacillota bacterium]